MTVTAPVWLSLVKIAASMSAPAKLFFSTIEVTKQAFYRSQLSYAIVNLKPIVPGRASSVISTGSPARPTTATRCARDTNSTGAQDKRPYLR
jgi:hypothetical protein